jgi:subtilisin-like proprotein convertase family protein
MDEVRLWGRALTTTEISRNFRSTLATYAGFNSNYSVPNDLAPDGVYTNLVLSLTFQDDEQVGQKFSMSDWSGCGFNAKNNGVTSLDLSNRPSTTIFQNESLGFTFGGYCASPDNVYNSPTNAITVEFWLYPSSLNGYTNILRKGLYDYGFRFGTAFTLLAKVNNTIFQSDYSFFNNDCFDKWTHVAFTYSQGNYKFYINGNEVKNGFQNVGNINNSADSLYIGEFFTGNLDEVRISNYVKTPDEIKKYMYVSFDKSNVPNQGNGNTSLCYSFDGYAVDNMGQAGTTVYFRKNAVFSAPATQSNVPVSPVNRNDAEAFPGGWIMSGVMKMYIPQNGFGGEISTSMQIASQPGIVINDVNVYIALNHQNDQDLGIYIISPELDTIKIYSGQNQLGANDNIITIFDDQADSSLLPNRYTSFGPIVKPHKGINIILNGKDPSGIWTLRVVDNGNASDVGILYCWGLQINNGSVLDNKTVQNSEELNTPYSFSLAQNYPNPFNPSTGISFSIGKDGLAKLIVFDVLGKEIAVLVNNELKAGHYNVNFNASGLSSGVYFYRLDAAGFSETKKMMLVK